MSKELGNVLINECLNIGMAKSENELKEDSIKHIFDYSNNEIRMKLLLRRIVGLVLAEPGDHYFYLTIDDQVLTFPNIKTGIDLQTLIDLG